MSKVLILSEEVISKIAAGEVIERPASVVKELIENAIDAQSCAIEVYLKKAGQALIYMKDNGAGIEADDLEKIFLRHATSKIANIEDLYAINSLGFRGEALYSIAAVADVTLRSKTKDSSSGWQIHLRGAKKLDLRPVSMATGTEIEIKELFFNTPARRKFLKTTSAEINQIFNIFIPYTLLYPRYSFKLSHNNRVLYNLNSVQQSLSRISEVLKLEKQHLIETNGELKEKGLRVRLLLGDMNIQRTRKDMQFIFINNRPIHNHTISFHINQVYRSLMPAGIYPFFSIYLDIPSGNVDVNFHPTKREVKIKDEYTIISFLRSLCEKALASYGKARQAEAVTRASFSEFSISDTPGAKQYVLYEDSYKTAGEISVAENKQDSFFGADKDYSLPYCGGETNFTSKLSQARYIGNFMKKYLFFETQESLLIIDQHAAQERVTFESLLRQITSAKVEVQRLLSPLIMKVTQQELLVWEVIKDKLETVGFSVTLWDNENIALHSYPNLVFNPKIALRNLLDSEGQRQVDIESIARRACRGSLMAGYDINFEQAQYLRAQLLKCKEPFTCPHGRPTVVEIQEKILSKQFLR